MPIGGDQTVPVGPCRGGEGLVADDVCLLVFTQERPWVYATAAEIPLEHLPVADAGETSSTEPGASRRPAAVERQAAHRAPARRRRRRHGHGRDRQAARGGLGHLERHPGRASRRQPARRRQDAHRARPRRRRRHERHPRARQAPCGGLGHLERHPGGPSRRQPAVKRPAAHRAPARRRRRRHGHGRARQAPRGGLGHLERHPGRASRRQPARRRQDAHRARPRRRRRHERHPRARQAPRGGLGHLERHPGRASRRQPARRRQDAHRARPQRGGHHQRHRRPRAAPHAARRPGEARRRPEHPQRRLHHDRLGHHRVRCRGLHSERFGHRHPRHRDLPADRPGRARQHDRRRGRHPARRDLGRLVGQRRRPPRLLQRLGTDRLRRQHRGRLHRRRRHHRGRVPQQRRHPPHLRRDLRDLALGEVHQPLGVWTLPEHLAFPIAVTSQGLATVEQDSDADIRQSVALLLNTRPGERRSEPNYGLPDPVFGQPAPRGRRLGRRGVGGPRRPRPASTSPTSPDRRHSPCPSTRPELDTDEDAVTERILTGLTTRLDGWEAYEGAPEVALAEEIGREAAVLNQSMIDVLDLAVAGMGETAFGFPAYQGALATIPVSIDVNATGTIIPAGFTVYGINDNGDEIAFVLLEDVGAPTPTVAATMTATESGDFSNGIPAGETHHRHRHHQRHRRDRHRPQQQRRRPRVSSRTTSTGSATTSAHCAQGA
ncbi:hypothetical protein G5V59_00170 [Nocardioides sp. W3-2-3]|uniref:GPW/gp25 family protein n=1 Tax=Nocardioides convexus TaxID=2712224 RepID=UPI0024182F88|nr:GPW/gp25 family protein [Nocardioides convexus]NGZ99388.1 hypothetical protein [Nocardioides convexus]